jgi:hypothetical protein
MTAQAAVDAQRALEIYRIAGFDASQICPLETFLQEIEHQLLVPVRRNRETTSVDSHAFAPGHARCRAWGCNHKLHRLVGAAQPSDLPNFAN